MRRFARSSCRRLRVQPRCPRLPRWRARRRRARIVVVQGSDSPRLERTLAALRERVAAARRRRCRCRRAATTRYEATWSRSDRGSVLVALGPHASDAVVRLALPGPVVHCLAGRGRRCAPARPRCPPRFPSTSRPRGSRSSCRPRGRSRSSSTRRSTRGAPRPRGRRWPSPATARCSSRSPRPPALPAALEALVGRADVLLALPRRHRSTRANPRAGCMLYCFRKRIPIVGPDARLGEARRALRARLGLRRGRRDLRRAGRTRSRSAKAPRAGRPASARVREPEVRQRTSASRGTPSCCKQVDLRHD